jgi:tetratricopeptide (TPR) repeat protein
MGVADALDVAVAFTSRNELDPLNSQAVEYYLQGQEILRTSSTLDSARQAQALFQRSLDVQPAFTLGTAGLCHALLLEFSRTEAPEHFERAKRRCLEALEQDGQSIQSRVTLGNLYNKVGDHAQAEAILFAAAAQSPYYERTYYHLARTYDALGRIEEAEAAFARSISLEPGFWGTYLGYGNFLARHQRYDEAIIEFRKITEIAPEEFVGYASMGASYFESGQLELAAEYIEKSLEINENSRSYFNLGLIHQSLGNYPQASDGFSRAVEMNPQNYRALMFLADVQEQAGDARLAVSTNRRALEVADGLVAINPADGYVLAHTAILLAGLGDNDEAKLRVEHAIELEATNPKVRFESAVVFESLGDRQRAVAEMRTALRLGYPAKMFQSSSATTPFKNDPEIQQLLGDL